MPENHRGRERDFAVDHAQVALAQAARDDADLDFTGGAGGVADGDAVDQLAIGAVEDNCFQPLTSLFSENSPAWCANAQKSAAGNEGDEENPGRTAAFVSTLVMLGGADTPTVKFPEVGGRCVPCTLPRRCGLPARGATSAGCSSTREDDRTRAHMLTLS